MNILKFLSSLSLGNQRGAIGPHYATNQGAASASSTALRTDDVTRTGATRAEEIKRIAYGTELWVEAQAKMSELSAHVTNVQQDGNYKIYDRVKQQKLSPATSAVHRTQYQKQEFSRRALFTHPYEAAVVISREDARNNPVDVLAAARTQLMYASARLKDEEIMKALVQPVDEASDATNEAADSDAGTTGDYMRLRASTALTRKHQTVFYAPKAVLDAQKMSTREAAEVGLTPQIIEDVATEFLNRDVRGQVVCAITPQMRAELRQDPQFRNLEDLYTVEKGGAGLKFRYKNVILIVVSPNVRPDLSANLSTAAGAKATGNNVHLNCWQLGSGGKVGAKESDLVLDDALALQSGQATVKVATGSGVADAAKKANEQSKVAYFWVPEGLYFADEMGSVFVKTSDLPELAHATQVYFSVRCGATMIDSQYTLPVVLKGLA